MTVCWIVLGYFLGGVPVALYSNKKKFLVFAKTCYQQNVWDENNQPSFQPAVFYTV